MKPDHAVVSTRRLAIMQNPHAARNEPPKVSALHALRALLENEATADVRKRRRPPLDDRAA